MLRPPPAPTAVILSVLMKVCHRRYSDTGGSALNCKEKCTFCLLLGHKNTLMVFSIHWIINALHETTRSREIPHPFAGLVR